VLLASLTKTAAHELAGRDLPIDARRIGTLHAHAFRAMGGGTVAESKAREWNDWCEERGTPGRGACHLRARRTWTTRWTKGRRATTENDGVKTDGDVFLETVGTWRARAVPRPIWIVQVQVLRFAEAWDEWKAETGYLDFTDMIETCLRERIPPPVDFDVMFLDETQDSSRLEVMLALQWGALGETLVVAGDVRQNLYEWRGVGARRVPGDRPRLPGSRVLSQSYRVPAAVHATPVAWAKQLSQDIEAEYHPRRDDGAIVAGEVVDGPSLGARSGSSTTRPKPLSWAGRSCCSAPRGAWSITTSRSYGGTGCCSTIRIARRRALEPDRRSAPWSRSRCAARGVLADGRSDLGAGRGSGRPTRSRRGSSRSGRRLREGLQESAPAGEAVTPEQFRAMVPERGALESDVLGRSGLVRVCVDRGPAQGRPVQVPARRGREARRQGADRAAAHHGGDGPQSVKGGRVGRRATWLRTSLGPAMTRGSIEDTRDQVVRVFYVALTRAREKLVLLRPMGGLSVDL
jgi:hypothetical protein